MLTRGKKIVNWDPRVLGRILCLGGKHTYLYALPAVVLVGKEDSEVIPLFKVRHDNRWIASDARKGVEDVRTNERMKCSRC